MKKMAAVATKTDPELWERCKRDAKARMGGKHSARAMQLATQLYKKRGGGYSGSKPTAKSNSLKKWTKQKWKWSGGDKKGQGGKGVYLPSKKVDRLKSTRAGRKALSSASRKKSKATREGRQYSSHGLAAGTSLRKTAMKNSAESLAKHILGPKAKVNDVLTADMPAARKRKILAKMREMGHKKKTAMMGNSAFTQSMVKNTKLPGYDEGGPVKKDGYVTNKKGEPYAKVEKGQHVEPKGGVEPKKRVSPFILAYRKLGKAAKEGLPLSDSSSLRPGFPKQEKGDSPKAGATYTLRF